jgi:HK97 family phage portal protein
MSILGKIKATLRSRTSENITLKDPGAWENILPTKSHSGAYVTHETALNLSTVFACVRRSSETLSTLPVHVYRKNAIGREEIDHPVARLLGLSPNPEMPANVFREVIQGHLELRGRAFAEIVKDGRGRPVELWPIHPDKIRVERSKTGKLVYVYIPTNYPFPAEKILHFRGFGSTGIDSYSIITLARESIGLGLSAQEYGARFFGQGTNMGGFLKHQKGLSDEAYERLRKEMNQKYRGLERSHGLIILEEGMDYQKIGLTNEDAQFLETRKFQVTEIARWFGMQPHMVGDMEKATFSNIEQQSIEAVIYTWRPRAVRLEQELNMKLLQPGEYVKFSLEGLLRGDIKSRYEAYKIGVENGWLNADEVRALEDMNPQPDNMGQIFLAPLNMTNKANYLTGGNPPVEKDPQRSTPAIKETRVNRRSRESRSIADRRYTADRYRGELRAATEKVVEEELRWLKEELEHKDAQAAKEYIITEFGSLESFVAETFALIYRRASEDLYPIFAEELGKDTAPGDDFAQRIDEYITAFAKRFISQDRGQLVTAIKDAIDADEDYHAVIDSRTESWPADKPQSIEKLETTRMRNYFALSAYASMGISKIRSVAHGDSCPYCNAIDGTVVDVMQPFVKKGEEFKPEGAQYPLIPTSNRSHPPYHDGCDCDIVSEA